MNFELTSQQNNISFYHDIINQLNQSILQSFALNLECNLQDHIQPEFNLQVQQQKIKRKYVKKNTKAIDENNEGLIIQQSETIQKPKRKYTKRKQAISQQNPKEICSKRKYSELDNEQISETEEICSQTQILEDIVEQIPSPKKKQKGVDGPFTMEGFSWFEIPESTKKYLKINKKEIQGIDVNCFDKQKVYQKEDMGKQVHRQIEIYLDTNSKQEINKFFYPNEAKYICFIIDKTIEYLKLRGMNVFKTEKEVQSNFQYKKYIDLLAYNETKKECVVVDWKFSKYTPEHKIKYGDSHFIQQINATKNQFKDYTITLLVVPLKNIRNLRFIEFTKEEIQTKQKDQAQSQSYQNQKIFMLRKKMNEEQIHNKRRCTIRHQYSSLSLSQFANLIIQKNDIEELTFFKDIKNSEIYKDDNECSFDSKYDQFYIIYILLVSQEKYLM